MNQTMNNPSELLNGVEDPNWINSASVSSLEGLCTPAANPITNIVWQWTSVSNKTTGATTTVANPQAYTIIFGDDSTLSGQADCNTFTGTYSQEGGFFITLGAMTMAACGEDSLDQPYLQLLGSIAAGGPDGAGNLALETAGGEQRILFNSGDTAAK